MSEEIKVLDQGYVKIVGSWGCDEQIIEAARMSTNKGFQGWDILCDKCDGRGCHDDEPDTLPTMCKACKGTGYTGDQHLLKYLWDHKHHTPFEMAGFTIEVQAPIFVFREWHRHRTQSYNEMSGRYIELPDMYYIPSIERLQNAGQDWVNKQSSGKGIHPRAARHLQRRIQAACEESRRTYESLLHDGLAREVARVVLPVNQYSRMRASANLRNWLHFLSLRTDAGAQWEIRQYAEAVASYVEMMFPRTYALWKS